MNNGEPPAVPSGTEPAAPVTSPQNAAFKKIVEKANGGDAEALTQLRAILDENPAVWKQIGDLSAHVQLSWMRLVAGDDKLLLESVERRAAMMERELLSDAPTTLERLAVERIVACWLQSAHADARAASAVSESVAQARFWTVHQQRCARRLDAAYRSLAVIRNLLPKEEGKAAKRRKLHA